MLERRERVRAPGKHGLPTPLRGRRHLAGHESIERGSQPVTVGPRTMGPLAQGLFGRRVTRAARRGCAITRLGMGNSCCAEIQQYRRTVTTNEDVGWLDVAMHDALPLHGIECVQQRVQQGRHFGRVERPALDQEVIQWSPLDPVHEQISSAIGLEMTNHASDVGVAEPRLGSPLDEKTRESGAECILLSRLRPHRAVICPKGDPFREILLQGKRQP